MQFKLIPFNDSEQQLHDRALKTARGQKMSEPEMIVIIEAVDRLKLFEKSEGDDS